MNRRLILTALVGAALTGACAGAPAPTPQIVYASPQIVTLPTPSPEVVVQVPQVCVEYIADVDQFIAIEQQSWKDEAGKGVTQADIDALNALVPKFNADQKACGALIPNGPQA